MKRKKLKMSSDVTTMTSILASKNNPVMSKRSHSGLSMSITRNSNST